MMFANVFRSLWSGSMCAPGATRQLTFVWMIANADSDGTGEANPAFLAPLFGPPVTVDDVREALSLLSGPDPDSRSKEADGARIERIDGHLWRIVNYEHYRDLARRDQIRASTRERVRAFRQRKREAALQPVTNALGERHAALNVTPTSIGEMREERREKKKTKDSIRHRDDETDANADADASSIENRAGKGQAQAKPQSRRKRSESAYPEAFDAVWSLVLRPERREDAIRAFDAAADRDGPFIATELLERQVRAYNDLVQIERVERRFMKQGGTLFSAILNGDDFAMMALRKVGAVSDNPNEPEAF